MTKTVLYTMMWLVAAAYLVPSSVAAQPIHPASINLSPGVHIVSYNSFSHRSKAHYEALCRIVLTEFGLPTDSICLTLVLLNKSLMTTLVQHNNDWFDGDGWKGMCLGQYLVMMDGNREADDTFMHEYMHVLYRQGKLFQKYSPEQAHDLVRMNEALLLGSASYLKYLQSLPKPKVVTDE